MWCILIPLLTGLICGILGYLLGKMLNKNDQFDDSVYKSRISKLESDLEFCKANKIKPIAENTAKGTNKSTSTKVKKAATTVFNSEAAKAVFRKKVKENDLTLIDGIGPKIQELFHKNNINTWQALSECSVDKCKEVLNSGGDRFKIHKPGTWPKQSKMAANGKWQELKDWQNQLDGGKQPTT